MIEVIKDKAGVVLEKDNYKVVKKLLNINDEIKKHNHEDSEVVFNVIEGNLELKFNDEITYTVKKGDIVNFDGINYIEGKALEKSEVNIILIKKM